MTEPISPAAFVGLLISALKGSHGPRSISFAIAQCACEIAHLRNSGVTWPQIGASINEALSKAGRDPVPTATIRGLYSRCRPRFPPRGVHIIQSVVAVHPQSEATRQPAFGAGSFLERAVGTAEKLNRLRNSK
jgi:hypothetical protein